MKASEWRQALDSDEVVLRDTVDVILDDLEALESFAEGLEGTNDQQRARIEELEKERDDLAIKLGVERACRKDAEAEVTKLRKALKRYGKHHNTCGYTFDQQTQTGELTQQVCSVSDYLPHRKANARLLASAPELLIALKDFVEVTEGDGAVKRFAQAVIAKAEGRM